MKWIKRYLQRRNTLNQNISWLQVRLLDALDRDASMLFDDVDSIEKRLASVEQRLNRAGQKAAEASILSKPIAFLFEGHAIDQLTARARNGLAWHGVKTIGELVNLTPKQVKSIPHIGNDTLGHIGDRLAAHGLSLKEGK